ncbi:unnamed protein product [Prorocentrum cordatum]|uniref:Uncharacterized protein n=1 Tax=Prorocentrum cordatum TaxID=2364126 RepID=A0ABN9UGU5_9DINO|nr:unnamed protein product [Polarella glacialis]
MPSSAALRASLSPQTRGQQQGGQNPNGTLPARHLDIMPGSARPKRVIIAHRTREERRAERRGVPLLRRSARLEMRYDVALTKFFPYFRLNGVDLPQSPCAVDDTLVGYITFLWEDGDTSGLLGDATSEVQARIPSLKKCLHGSWLMLKAWENKELPVQAPPLPRAVAWGLVGLALEVGFTGVACAFAIACHCMLRTAEALCLQASDIALGQSSTVITLPFTKKVLRDTVAIHDTLVTRLFAQRLNSLLPGDQLADVSCQ